MDVFGAIIQVLPNVLAVFVSIAVFFVIVFLLSKRFGLFREDPEQPLKDKKSKG